MFWGLGQSRLRKKFDIELGGPTKRMVWGGSTSIEKIVAKANSLLSSNLKELKTMVGVKADK